MFHVATHRLFTPMRVMVRLYWSDDFRGIVPLPLPLPSDTSWKVISMDRFKEKVVLVTGAASRIGATAKRFCDEGAKVAIIDIADLSDTQASLDPEHTLAITADVSDPAQAEDMMARTIAHFGRLDVLVNNAGIFASRDPENIPDEDWRKVIATDLDGVFYGSRAAISHLEKTKGSIINAASVFGAGGDWNMLPITPPKAGS